MKSVIALIPDFEEADTKHVSFCSAEQGWTLCNPDGDAFAAGTPGAAAEVALHLLLPELSGHERRAALSAAMEAEGGTVRALDSHSSKGLQPAL